MSFKFRLELVKAFSTISNVLIKIGLIISSNFSLERETTLPSISVDANSSLFSNSFK